MGMPTVDEIKKFLDEYGWRYRLAAKDDNQALLSSYTLEDDKHGILICYRIVGEFVMVSTMGIFKDVPADKASWFLELNDEVKLVKFFSIAGKNPDRLDIELGFELWQESWNKETFFAFMDMLCLAIDTTMKKVKERDLPHKTDYVTFEDDLKTKS